LLPFFRRFFLPSPFQLFNFSKGFPLSSLISFIKNPLRSYLCSQNMNINFNINIDININIIKLFW
jgi:hypothetical protein